MMNSVKGEMNVAAVSVSSVQKLWLPWSWEDFASSNHTLLNLLKCNALHCFLAGINGGKWPRSCKTLLSRACPAPCFTPPRATLTIYFLDFISIPGAHKSTGFEEDQPAFQTLQPSSDRQLSLSFGSQVSSTCL